MLCHAQEMAQGSTASGCAAKKVPAMTVASPAFCMPTSMDMVRFLALLNPANFPAVHPSRYPKELWQNTTAKVHTNSIRPRAMRSSWTVLSGEAGVLGISVIEETAYSNGDDSDNQDIEEHADGIDFDDFSCGQLHQQRGHHGG